jgi:protein tyrosine phosphatase (PTP) superfamily phosphohydrolase (DUF442 family)
MSERLIVLLSAFAAFAVAGCRGAAPSPAPGDAVPRVQLLGQRPGLHNVVRLSDRLLSGSSPDGEDGFASLAAMGVRTVISVDGATPDVGLARAAGMRYIHLPIGYDGVPRDRAHAIARAIVDAPEAVYLHCHHGKHRGPAAAVAALRCIDPAWTTAAARQAMELAQTDPRYAGLYRDVEAIERLPIDDLRARRFELPEIARIGELTQAMVQLDACWDRIKAVRAAGWRTPPGQPDVEPAHEARLLYEHYEELLRRPDSAQRPPSYAAELTRGRDFAKQLEDRLREKAPGDVIESAYRGVAATCTACHAEHRDR